MVPVDRDTSLQHNPFTKSMSLPATIDDPSDISGNASQFATSYETNHSPTANVNVNDNILSPEEESKRSIEDFLGKIDSNLAKTKKYVKNR